MDLEEQDPAAKAEELSEKVDEFTEEQEAKQNALLEAVAEDEELVIEETEQVEIGEAIITASTELTGDTLRKVDSVQNNTELSEAIDTAVDVLVDQTECVEAATEEGSVTIESDGEIREFYQTFIDSHDAQKAATLCFERVVEEPNELEQERREDAHKSFQKRR